VKNSSSFKDVFEGQEIELFFKKFINHEFSELPDNIESVLKDVKEIWKKEGFLTPAELEKSLIKKYLGDANNKTIELIKNIALSRNKGEEVTGYLGKEHAYLSTALAHLYSKEVKQHIAITEIDFSNMGGTNEYFRSCIAKEKNTNIENIPQQEGEGLTDSAARLIAGSLISKLVKKLPKGAKIIPIRSGGDELRILFTGVSDRKELVVLTDMLHEVIETHTAKMGLQGHRHLKAPDNPDRNGFGAALTIKDMSDIDNPENLIRDLDSEIKGWKYVLGRFRNGIIDEKFIKEETKARIKSGSFYFADKMREDLFIKEEIEKMIARARNRVVKIHSYNPGSCYKIKDLKGYIAENLEELPSSIITPQSCKSICDLSNLSEEDLSELPPMASLEDRRIYLAEKNMREHGVELSDKERYLLKLAVANITSIDPSAQALMPSEMVLSIDAAESDVEDFQKLFYRNSEVLSKTLSDSELESIEDIKPYTMGVSLHGLAALNDILGHHITDIILKGFAQEVIEKSIVEACAEENNIDKNFYNIAHHGGGNFTILLKPNYLGVDIAPVLFSKAVTNRISKNIEEQMIELNNSDIERFLESKGLSIDDSLKADFQKRGISKLSELEDSKTRTINIDGRVFSKKINGLHVAVTSQELSFNLEKSGGAFISKIRRETDVEMEQIRNKLCYDEITKSELIREHKRGYKL